MKAYVYIIIYCFIFFINNLLFSIPDEYSEKIIILNKVLESKGVSSVWMNKNLNNIKFEIYYKMPEYFKNMAEIRVKNKEKDWEWYKNYFGLDLKVERGRIFINKNMEILKKIEMKNGISYFLIVSIIGMETGYANRRDKGHFYVFNALVSQYILMPERENFALRQLVALYKFCQKIKREVYYFKGSFAGASGWAQFLPTSLMDYFIDEKGDDTDLDIYSVEDCLYSIDNYLNKKNLNAGTINNKAILYSSIYSYNPSDAYVKAILYIYEKLKNK